jgi:hypothetical protein
MRCIMSTHPERFRSVTLPRGAFASVPLWLRDPYRMNARPMPSPSFFRYNLDSSVDVRARHL